MNLEYVLREQAKQFLRQICPKYALDSIEGGPVLTTLVHSIRFDTLNLLRKVVSVVLATARWRRHLFESSDGHGVEELIPP